MTINKATIDLIQHFESCRLIAYQDSKGIWTIGWGATYYQDGMRVKKDDKITQKVADELFAFHLNQFSNDIKKLIKVKLNDNQFGALLSFAFNCGTDIDMDNIPEGLGDSTLLKKINNNPSDITIRSEFMKWINKGSAFEKGLRRRRKKEADLYFS